MVQITQAAETVRVHTVLHLRWLWVRLHSPGGEGGRDGGQPRLLPTFTLPLFFQPALHPSCFWSGTPNPHSPPRGLPTTHFGGHFPDQTPCGSHGPGGTICTSTTCRPSYGLFYSQLSSQVLQLPARPSLCCSLRLDSLPVYLGGFRQESFPDSPSLGS